MTLGRVLLPCQRYTQASRKLSALCPCQNVLATPSLYASNLDLYALSSHVCNFSSRQQWTSIILLTTSFHDRRRTRRTCKTCWVKLPELSMIQMGRRKPMKIPQMMMCTLIDLTLSLPLPAQRFQNRSSVQAGQMFPAYHPQAGSLSQSL